MTSIILKINKICVKPKTMPKEEVKGNNENNSFQQRLPLSTLKDSNVNLTIDDFSLKTKLQDKLFKLTRHSVKFYDMVYMKLWFPNLKWRRKETKFTRNYKIFKEGESRIEQELDIVTIIKSLRKSNALIDALLDK